MDNFRSFEDMINLIVSPFVLVLRQLRGLRHWNILATRLQIHSCRYSLWMSKLQIQYLKEYNDILFGLECPIDPQQGVPSRRTKD